MRRFIDRGAITAGWVGIGMAVTIAASFLLIIPIEPIYWYLALPAGLLIGYYANARSARAGGPWRRIVANSLYAGLVTGLTYAAFLLVIKLIFFYADTGYPNFNRVDENGTPIPPTCQTGADCVYSRYLEAGQGPAFEANGITDVAELHGVLLEPAALDRRADARAHDRRRADRRGGVRVHEPASAVAEAGAPVA